jgi:[ribosomal protein S5]-alanine N-acetyltransferase
MHPFLPPRRIESDDLLLRPLEPRDAQALFDDMLGDPDTTRHLSFARHATLDETLVYIEQAERGWETGELIRWVLEDKASGALSAVIELRPLPPRVELGVMIARRGTARRRRAGLYVLRKLLKWLLVQPPVYRIYACCATDGDAYRSMERLGFTLEAKLINYEPRPNLGLVAADSYLFAMTRPAQLPPVDSGTAWLAAHAQWDRPSH